jgi:hypothetical protein
MLLWPTPGATVALLFLKLDGAASIDKALAEGSAKTSHGVFVFVRDDFGI